MADDRYDGTPVTGDRAVSLLDIGLSSGLAANSILELDVTVNTEATTGIVFDYYGPEDFKYAGLSADSDTLIIGHYKSGQWVVDASTNVAVKDRSDYDFALSLKGTTVSVSLKAAGAKNWQAMVGHVFSAVSVDGAFGLLAKEGMASFDTVTIRTDDPAFQTDDLMASGAPETGAGADSILTRNGLAPIMDEAIDRWEVALEGNDDLAGALHEVNFQILDFDGLTLGRAIGNTVYIDADAAGYGWFVDDTPADDVEFGLPGGNGEFLADSLSDAFGQMDLLTVVMHEMGHVLGYEDLMSEADAGDLMYEMLTSGTRRTETRLAVTSESVDDATAGWLGLGILKNGRSTFSDWHSEWLQRHRLLP